MAYRNYARPKSATLRTSYLVDLLRYHIYYRSVLPRLLLLLCASALTTGCLLVDAFTGSDSADDGGLSIDGAQARDVDAASSDASPVDAMLLDASAVDGAAPDGGANAGDGGDPCVLACPAATAGKVTVCGQMYDAQTDQPLRVGAPTGAICSGGTTAGPCALEIRVFDALAYAENPMTAGPLAAEQISINDCGQFTVNNASVPGLGFLAIQTEDAAGSGVNTHAPVGQIFPVSSGERIPARRAFVLRNATDAAWTASAGEPFGAGVTFSQAGAYMPVFVGPDGAGGLVPRAGVIFAANAGTPTFFHFTDSSTTRSTVAVGQAATGTNGTAIATGTTLVDYSGSGGEPGGCQWPSQLAHAPQGVVVIQDWPAETATGAPCP